MTDDIRADAEFCERYYLERKTKGGASLSLEAPKRLARVIEHVLATVREDDEVQVCGYWLRKVGFITSGRADYRNGHLSMDMFTDDPDDPQAYWLELEGYPTKFATRGAVRRLASALGIALKEQA